MDNGEFRGVVSQWALGVTSTNKEQVAITLHLPDVNESITWYGYFTEKAEPITLKTLRMLGWKGDDISDLSETENAECMVVIAHEEYDGKVRPKVKWLNAIGGPALQNQMDTSAAKSFAARMKARVKAFDISEGKPKTNGKPVKSTSRTGPLSPEPPPYADQDELPDL